MGDLFTDTPDYTPIEEFPQDSEPDSVPVPEPTAVPPEEPEPVQPENGSPDVPTALPGDSSASTGEEAPAGVEEVPIADTITQIDYTDILSKQLEQIEFLVQETKAINQEMQTISHIFPVISCLLGIIIGILLLKILASYIRP